MSEDIESRLAIVGMAGRFPGAPSAEDLWRNLSHGVGGIRDITQEELTAARVPPAAQADPRYVRRGAPLSDTGLFDATFFGYSPREAEVADPQHRMFLECAWEALEVAGYRPNAVPGKVGVFGGVAPSQYGMRHVLGRPEVMATITLEQYGMGTTADSLCAVVAYKLGLTGPVLGVQTNCSTSLVAVHLAAQSLLTYDCDVALAGGAAIFDPLPTGYQFEEGSITSPDGVVHSLDADADGTVMGNGVGLVALKRLADAQRDGDHVWAVLLGSALNNDGAARAGYSAPGVDGQSAVMGYALAVAEVDPATVGYLECHATGTRLGDSIELAAVERAYTGTPATPRVLSSLKPDIGHLDRASGVAGLIKATLALHHRTLPATRGFKTPNAALAPLGDRFTVLTEDRPWPRPADHPRRAGVNSFGAGGTNVHVLLEEAPALPAPPAATGPHLLVLSARSRDALTTATRRLGDHLRSHPDLRLADVAHTLQASRTGFAHRAAVLCTDTEDAVRALASPDRLRTAGPVTPTGQRHRPTGPQDAAENWLAGADVDWSALHQGPRRRVPLPSYPFERRRYFLEPAELPAGLAGLGAPPATGRAAGGAPRPAGRIPEIGDWFSHPVWRTAPLPYGPSADDLRGRGPWWVVADGGPGLAAARLLAAQGADVVLLRPTGAARPVADLPGLRVRDIDPTVRADVERALVDLGRPRSVLHTLSLSAGQQADGDRQFADAQRLGFYSVLALVGALSQDSNPGPVDLLLCTAGAVEAVGGDLRHPEQATLLGLQPVINQEFGDLTCRLLDLDPADLELADLGLGDLAPAALAPGLDQAAPAPGRDSGLDRAAQDVGADPGLDQTAQDLRPAPGLDQAAPDQGPDPAATAGVTAHARLAAELLAETGTEGTEPAALRGPSRWIRSFDPIWVGPVREGQQPVPEQATILITGGLGTVGTAMARHFAAAGHRLVLTARTPLPPPEQWQQWLAEHPADDRTAGHLRTLIELREQGAQVLTAAADAADRDQMAAALAAARDRFGPIDVVIHAAGAQGREYFGFAPGLSRAVCEAHFATKVTGLRVLDELLAPDEAPLRLTMSSLAAVLGGVAYGPYAAANAAMDAYASALRPRTGWLPVNWDTWNLGEDPHGDYGVTMKDYFYDADEGCEVLERCLSVAHRVPQLTISTGPLEQRFDQWTRLNQTEPTPPRTRYPRPELLVPFEPPASEREAALVEIWSEILGIDGLGVNDNFFDLGGHSLAAVRMMAQVRAEFGGFPGDVLIENPTVRSFSKVLPAPHAAP